MVISSRKDSEYPTRRCLVIVITSVIASPSSDLAIVGFPDNSKMESTVEHPTATWDAMPDGNVFYRRLQLYSIPGKFPDLNDYIISGCRNGGPIGVCRASALSVVQSTHLNRAALMRDSSKIVAIGRGGTSSRSQVQVYSPAGEGLLLFNVDIL